MKINTEILNNIIYIGKNVWLYKGVHYTAMSSCETCKQPFFADIKMSACRFCCVDCYRQSTKNIKPECRKMTDIEREKLLIETYEILQKSVRNSDFLNERLGFSRDDLIQEVIKVFLENKYMDRYNPNKCPLSAYVNTYKLLVIGNLYKKARALKRECLSIPLNYHDKEGSETYYTHAVNYETPEDIVIDEEFLSAARKFFTPEEYDILIGELTQTELAAVYGITRQAVNSSLKRKTKKFQEVI